MKKNILLISIFSMFLIVFNLLFFLLGDNSIRNLSLWISYGFIHFSYIIFLLSIFINRKGDGDNAYDAPTIYVTWKYFIVELFVGLIFIWINLEGIGWALTIQLLIAAVSIVMWLIHLMANEHTADSIQIQKKEILFIKESSERLKLLSYKTQDRELTRRIEKCYDIVNSSPIHSSINVNHLEKNISNSISELADAIDDKNLELAGRLIEQITCLVQERNLKLKMNI